MFPPHFLKYLDTGLKRIKAGVVSWFGDWEIMDLKLRQKPCCFIAMKSGG
jgi:hypothetical protein